MSSMEQRITEHIPRLRRYARALFSGDLLAADELVQDCLERALGRLHHWRAGSDLRAWLFTIMHNLYVNHIQRVNNGPEFIGIPEHDAPFMAASRAERLLELRDLGRAIAGLSPEQREVLLLVTLEGLRYHEVSKILGIPEGTVMSRLSRARQQVRKTLDGKVEGIRRVK